MKIIDSKSGRAYFQKRRRRYDEAGHARELTFSCYRRYGFLRSERVREWFREALEAARRKWQFDLWAYVLMPEHVHLLIYPRPTGGSISSMLRDVKEPVARRAIEYLKQHERQCLTRLTVREGRRVRHRFWQPGGGYDRNIIELKTLHRVIEYIHANPVRRGLVESAVDWEWSSARWYVGIRPVPIEMDRTIPRDSDNKFG